MLDQGVNYLVADQSTTTAIRGGLVPVDREDAPKLFVCGADAPHCGSENFSEVRRSRENITPVRAVGDREPVLPAGPEDRPLVLAKRPVLLLLKLVDCFVGLVLPLVGQ